MCHIAVNYSQNEAANEACNCALNRWRATMPASAARYGGAGVASLAQYATKLDSCRPSGAVSVNVSIVRQPSR